MQINNRGDIRYSEEDLKALRKSIDYVKNLDFNNEKESINEKEIARKVA